jgi:predicted membrane GTPase involved in stress response
VQFKGTKLILMTGHTRILVEKWNDVSLADGVCLLVDTFEGPMPPAPLVYF